MNHQSHVFLIDPHAKGVGSDDGPHVAMDEAPLYVLPGLRRQARMEMVCRQLPDLQVFGNLLAPAPRCAVDDGPTVPGGQQVFRQEAMDVGQLLAACGGDHLEGQVGSVGATVKDVQIHVQLVVKVLHDFLDHLRLGSGGQAQHRWDGSFLLTGLLADKAAHIAVIGAEIMAPAG